MGERIQYNLTSSSKTHEIIIRDSKIFVGMITDINRSASVNNQCLHAMYLSDFYDVISTSRFELVQRTNFQ